MCGGDVPKSRTIAGRACIERSIQSGILNSAAGDSDDGSGPVVSALGGNIKVGANNTNGHWRSI